MADSRPFVLRGLALITVAVLAGCARPVPVVEERSPAPLPDADYQAAVSDGATVYRVVPQESLVLVHVGRAGAMQRLGHEHAVASEDVQGWVEVATDPAMSRSDLAFPVRNLHVDEPRYRERLALDTEPSAEDIAGTYTNMLKVLEPARYPWVVLHTSIDSLSGDRAVLGVTVTLHGASYEYHVPAAVHIDSGRMELSGEARLRHTDFGLEPFSAAGGLLRVADELGIEFRIVANRVAPPAVSMNDPGRP